MVMGFDILEMTIKKISERKYELPLPHLYIIGHKQTRYSCAENNLIPSHAIIISHERFTFTYSQVYYNLCLCLFNSDLRNVEVGQCAITANVHMSLFLS